MELRFSVAYLLPVDVERLQLIPLDLFKRLDCWVWHYELHENYAVKGGYRLAFSYKLAATHTNATSSSSVPLGMWRKL